ncbi:sulfoxide reductase heme-binding subunit YedZ [Spongiibacter sp. KMU-158]|uniref:Protein-methionine-sulfoxide reductase heme-binding subunit MsrQ n=1 Tax=Spongiibacter pelagi TaxID=2760804 RepID=A0A927C3T1_9GAMM|nr:protein-methionine-sulfoxide reductase heme-binding subunit MsrQ [Spongiibacter pelagi]MBD2858955.1 sulfoxide reductase heme-binding subunit YedZ [Spongiibacter pelagi]
MDLRQFERRLGKPLLFIVSLIPLGMLVWAALQNQLGTDPVKTLILETGEWALRFLILTLAVSPLKAWFAWTVVIRYRRMLGLYAWFYASIHLLIVLTYLFGWDWVIAKEELAERPYIFVGFAAWLLMVPLGLTSNNYAIRKLKKNWKSLHKLIYLIAVLAWLHLAWQIRASYLEALVYGLIIFCLFFQRLKKVYKRC